MTFARKGSASSRGTPVCSFRQASVTRRVAMPKARSTKLPSNGATGRPLRSTIQPEREPRLTVVCDGVGLNTRTSSAPASRLMADTSAPSRRSIDPESGRVPPPGGVDELERQERVVDEGVGVGAVDLERVVGLYDLADHLQSRDRGQRPRRQAAGRPCRDARACRSTARA